MPPSTLVILTDDMPASQLAYMPSTMARLAGEGVRFTNAVTTSPVCGPNRVSFWSGQYVHAHGITSNQDTADEFKGRDHLGRLLQVYGYKTAIIGKWLNGTTSTQISPWPYVEPGFDDWRVFVNEGGYYGFKLIENGTIVQYDTTQYSTVVLSQHVRNFLSAVPSAQPFFCVFAPKAPHAPFEEETLADKTYAQSLPLPSSPAINEMDVSDKPAFIRALPLLTDVQMQQTRKNWRGQNATLQSVDRQVVAILDHLQALGRLETTDIYFTSDNGHVHGEHRLDKGKGCIYEECIHVPLIVRMAGVPPRVDPALVSTVDLTATIRARAGATAPQHGRDMTPMLQDASAPWNEDVLVEFLSTVGERPPFQAVRTRDDVYAEYLNGEREYYDLAVDPYQLDNMVLDPAYAARVAVLTSRLALLKGA